MEGKVKYTTWNQDILIENLVEIFGNKYDYSKTVWKNAHTRFTLTCPKHGDFSLRKDSIHKGCSKCKSEDTFTKELFIEKAVNRHGNKYDYTEVDYQGSEVKAKIWCNTHKEFFWQTPKKHVNGRGCPKCGIDSMAELQSKSFEDYRPTLEAKYKGILDFSNTKYTKWKSKIQVLDVRYGDIITTTIASLLRDNYTPKLSNKDRFLKEVELRGITGYDYSNVVWSRSIPKVDIKCNKCGDVFPQTPSKHIQGRGCPYCKISGFRTNRPAQVYYLKVKYEDNLYYKIGITNRTYKERYTLTDLALVEEAHVLFFDNGQDALDLETKIKREFKEYLYTGGSIILQGAKGNAELFTKDVLNKFNAE